MDQLQGTDVYILSVYISHAVSVFRALYGTWKKGMGMCLLLGHHRIMAATEATLLMMVLKEVVKVVLGDHRSHQPSGRIRVELAMI